MTTIQDDSLVAEDRVNLDWTRSPPPPNLTPYQRCIRDVQWAETALGPMHSWSRDLRQMVRFMMAEVNPVILYWGNQRTIIYNEAHVPMIGKKHPRMLGMKASDAFPEFWSYFEDVIAEQQRTGLTRVGEASLLLMERHGFLEETYFNWKLIPVIGDDGSFIGNYGMPTESTADIINERRVACVQHLTEQIVKTTSSFEELWQGTIAGLSQNEKDIPLALLYSVRQALTRGDVKKSLDDTDYTLEGQLGMPQSHSGGRKRPRLHQHQDSFAGLIHRAVSEEAIFSCTLSDASLEHVFQGTEWRGFGVPIHELAVLPIKTEGIVTAVLIIGLNPRLRFTSKYQDFIKIIGDVVSPQILRLKLLEEVKCRERIALSAVSDFQRSEIKFSRFAQRSPLGLALTNSDGQILYANEAWYGFCGLSSGQRELANWIDTVYEEDLPLVFDWWHKVTDLKEGGTFQVRLKKPVLSDKRPPYLTAIVALYPDLDEDGNVASVMSLVTDISELKWTESQLRLRQKELEESEQKYRYFAETAPIGVVRTDAQGYLQFSNDTWRSFYGFERDHKFTDPQPWLTSLNKEDVPLAMEFFDEICRTARPKTVEVRLRKRRHAKEVDRATPMEFWLLATGFAECRPDGSIDNIMFWVTDISDQKAAEKVLTVKMEEAIRLKNTQERFVDMISHEIRNPLSAILHCGEEIVDAMKNCLVSLDLPTTYQPLSRAQSSEAGARNYVSSALDAANTIMYCVQHQKQIVDDVLTLSKLDADLLIVSPVEVQPSDLLKSALKIFEPELKASNIELKLEIGPSLRELHVDWIMLDPNRFLQIVINLVTNAIKFTRKAVTRKIIIRVAAQYEKPVSQTHGVQYVPRREIDKNAIESWANDDMDEASPDHMYLCFSITDTGKGLTISERLSLFSRFSQASPKTHIEYGGSGLGLFISRQITEMLGGEIGVGSEPGKGATFAFYVRTRRVSAPARASLEPPAASLLTKTIMHPTPNDWISEQDESSVPAAPDANQGRVVPTIKGETRPRRVLVVEDNLVNQRVLCKQLRNRGFLVDAANHGREALDALEKVKKEKQLSGFDIILCDIEMPVMDGIECVTEIRRLEAEGELKSHIPIIGVTANVRSKQVDAAMKVGMDGVTTKPYRIDDLIAHIERVSAAATTSDSH